MGGCATPGRHSTRCRSCRLPRALMLNGFAVQEFRLVYNNERFTPDYGLSLLRSWLHPHKMGAS